MDRLQFRLDDLMDTFGSSPSVIDISSESGEEFTVEPGNVNVIEERFRVGAPGSNAMTAFAGAAAMTLFPQSTVSQLDTDIIDTAGSQIERQLLDLIDEHQSNHSMTPSSFVSSEFEESPESPDDQEMAPQPPLNSYGRPSAAILPIPRERGRGRGLPRRSRPNYPPGFSADISNFTDLGDNISEVQTADHNNVIDYLHNRPPGVAANSHLTNPNQLTNPVPLMIQIPSVIPNFVAVHNDPPVPPFIQQAFIVQATHSTNILFLPAEERNVYRLSPTVMPNIAGFCDWCGKTYDQIALEILGEYLLATAYEAETVRDRNVRSRAFIDGFEAALFTFKSAGLSQPSTCMGAGVQR